MIYYDQLAVHCLVQNLDIRTFSRKFRSRKPQVPQLVVHPLKERRRTGLEEKRDRTHLPSPRHSMGLPYMPTLTPKTTPTDRHIWQSHGVSGSKLTIVRARSSTCLAFLMFIYRFCSEGPNRTVSFKCSLRGISMFQLARAYTAQAKTHEK